MLLFKKRFLPLIRSGEKTQTIRLWKFRRLRPGQRSYIPGVGYIRIGAVDEVRLEDLTGEDAALDGFESPARLREEIAALYQEQLVAGHKVYRVRFELAPDEKPRPKAEKSARRRRGAGNKPAACDPEA